MSKVEEIGFTIDAGIINRLGLELVAKSETAVSELIKNAYDADANNVKVTFTNSKYAIGGTLTIEDDGVGMIRSKLIDGFMRIATTDKINNPISDIYKRPKAGKKGIGRFATQRLGEKLTIITQTANEINAHKLTINWNDYSVNKDVTEIKNTLEDVEKQKKQGTTLIIENLRNTWSDAEIKRIYRYISELIQPNLLKVDDRSIVDENKKEAFEVSFWDDENSEPIADPQNMMLDKSVAVFKGYIDDNGIGYCTVESKKFNLCDNIIIKDFDDDNVKEIPFRFLIGSNIAFQVYYFIGGDRANYYYQNITKPELLAVLENLKKHGGIKLYRNGFKVPPYGDDPNDWLGISKKSRIGKGIPFTNNNLYGFVQITDTDKIFFEEVAGREGIIHKEAFGSLQKFISKAIESGFMNFASFLRNSKEFKDANNRSQDEVTTNSVQNTISKIQKATETLASDDKSSEQKSKAQTAIKKEVEKLLLQTNTIAGELEMMRVLAGVGLTIGEFIHEIKQFAPSFNGYLNYLVSKNLGVEIDEILSKMKGVFSSFQTYTAYFDTTISQNVIRELKPIDLKDVVRDFIEIAQADLDRRNISMTPEFSDKYLITKPMHISEWNTILQNLYSNSKKAIYRSGKKGDILIRCYKENETVLLSFYDNGDGIQDSYKERIFDAFFTTSSPVTANGTVADELTGSGLGLHIVKQIIINRNGRIWVDSPISNYHSCITIQLPLETEIN